MRDTRTRFQVAAALAAVIGCTSSDSGSGIKKDAAPDKGDTASGQETATSDAPRTDVGDAMMSVDMAASDTPTDHSFFETWLETPTGPCNEVTSTGCPPLAPHCLFDCGSSKKFSCYGEAGQPGGYDAPCSGYESSCDPGFVCMSSKCRKYCRVDTDCRAGSTCVGNSYCTGDPAGTVRWKTCSP